LNGGELVLDDLYLGLIADDFVALLHRADAADIQAHGRVELQCVAAGRHFRTLARHHDSDLHAQLVDEDHHRVRTLDVGGQLAQRLRHQARLQTGQLVAHLALDFGTWRQRRDRVDHDHVDCGRAHQHVGDLERLLAGVRLRDQQIVDIDAEFFGIARIERVFGVDECASTAELLRLGDDLQGQRRLARGLRTVDLDDAAARQAADAERDVERQRAGRNRIDRIRRPVAHAHDCALAELLFDLAQG
jgi:hypothetical protein